MFGVGDTLPGDAGGPYPWTGGGESVSGPPAHHRPFAPGGWTIGTRMMTRLRRAERLLVLQNPRNRRRNGTGEHGIVEGFDGRLRDERPSLALFETLAETRQLADRWSPHYNH